MKLYEVMNSPVQWDWIHSDEEVSLAEFEIGDNPYRVSFYVMENPFKGEEPPQVIDISFHTTDEEDEDGEDIHGITGTGGEFKVFATVVAIMSAYLKKHGPPAVVFSAEEPSRVKLYDRFVKRVGSMGYKLAKREQKHNGMTYLLVNK